MRHVTLLIGLVAAIAGSSSPASGQPYGIAWFTMDGGGLARTVGAEFELSGTAGQPDAGMKLTGGDFALTGGFWPGAAAGISPVGDCDGNGLVNLDDLEGLVGCIAGPRFSVNAGCYCADFDGDLDVDLADFALFADAIGDG